MSDKTAFERDQRESRGKKNKNKKKKKEFLFFRHSFLKDSVTRNSVTRRRVRINIKKLVCHGAATSRRKTDRRSRVPKKLS